MVSWRVADSDALLVAVCSGTHSSRLTCRFLPGELASEHISRHPPPTENDKPAKPVRTQTAAVAEETA